MLLCCLFQVLRIFIFMSVNYEKKLLLSSLSKLVCIRANTHTQKHVQVQEIEHEQWFTPTHSAHNITKCSTVPRHLSLCVCACVGGWGLSINMGLMEPSESCSVPSENDLITFAKWMSLEGVFAASGLKHTHLQPEREVVFQLEWLAAVPGSGYCFICTYLARSVTSLFFITSFWRLLSHSHLLLFKPLKHRLWFFLFFCS